ncbi:MAG TPA: CHAT domain-containing protein [Myxococcales bacterium]|nr:CHAT domain-containing protein [Myxococcales bacterium]
MECERKLGELFQLDVIGFRHAQIDPARARAPGRAPAPAGVPWWRALWDRIPTAPLLAVPGLAAALVVAFVYQGSQSVPDSLWQPGQVHRLTEGRSAYARATGYLPREEMLGAGDKLPAFPLQDLARLQQRGDPLALASAYLVRGQSGLADNALKELEGARDASADLDSERALAHLNRDSADRGDLEDALRFADQALQRNPKHGPALWNRALALEKLRLTMLAAKAFDQVAQLGEPGWAPEARAKADQLRRQTTKVRQSAQAAAAAGTALRDSGELPQGVFGGVMSHPDLRWYFYDAVRIRTSAADVAKLLPVAKQLDDLSGGTAAQEYVRWVTRRNFETRAPLARQYQRLLNGSDSKPQALIDQLWASGETDLAIGAASRMPGDWNVEAFEHKVRSLGDPWFDTLALKRRAEAEQARSPDAARALLQQAAQVARHAKIDFRYAQVMLSLAHLLLQESELDEAYAVLADGWESAHRTGDWANQVQFANEIGQMARLRNDDALARAYLEEAAERTQEDHDNQQEHFVWEQLAILDVDHLRWEPARMALDAAIATGIPLSTGAALALADVARVQPTLADRQAMEAFRSSLDKPRPLGPGAKALALNALGRWALENDPKEGVQLLRQAIQLALPAISDPEAQRAISYAYTSLMLDAAKRHEYEQVLSLIAEEAGAPFPPRCAVALIAKSERSAVIARGAGGELDGTFDGARKELVQERLDGLVPPHLISMLNGCGEVKVVARAPLYGRLGALPNQLPWSYAFLGDQAGGTASPEETSSPGPAKHLIVQSPQFTARREKYLRPLQAWRSKAEPDMVLLTGQDATPTAVRREMENATDVDIVTHSLVDARSDEAYLVLAEEGEGSDKLRAGQIAPGSLHRRPLVVLAACGAAHPAPVPRQPRSLPAALLRAGARAVLAAAGEIPEKEGPEFFSAVRARIRNGTTPAAALRDERQRWLARGEGRNWLESVLIFEITGEGRTP